MTTSTAQPGFHEAEIRETLHSLVRILEDADFSKRAHAYTEDATFVMFGAAPVHGREEMLRRLETGTVLRKEADGAWRIAREILCPVAQQSDASSNA